MLYIKYLLYKYNIILITIDMDDRSGKIYGYLATPKISKPLPRKQKFHI